MSIEPIKQAVALLDDQQQAELISYTLRLRCAQDPGHHQEDTDRLNDREQSHWLTPDEFEHRLDQN
jgi:hypothetical protein